MLLNILLCVYFQFSDSYFMCFVQGFLVVISGRIGWIVLPPSHPDPEVLSIFWIYYMPQRMCFLLVSQPAQQINGGLTAHEDSRWYKCISTKSISFESCLPVRWEPAVPYDMLLQNTSGKKNWCELIENTPHTFVTVTPVLLPTEANSPIPLELWYFKLLS